MYLEVFDPKREGGRISILCLGLAAMGMVSVAVCYGILYVLTSLGLVTAADTGIMNWVAVAAQYGIGVPVAWAIMRIVPPDRLERRSLSRRRLAVCFCILCFLLLAGQILGLLVNTWIGMQLGYTPFNPVDNTLETSDLLFTCVTTCILAPVTEEFLFRKMLLDRVNRLGDKPAMILSGLLFGLMHGNFYQFFYAMLVGMLFAYIYLRTGRLRYVILLHCGVNILFGAVSALLNELAVTNAAGVVLSYGWFILELVLAVLGLILFLREAPGARFLKGWLDTTCHEIFRVCLGNVGMILFLIQAGVSFLLLLR